MPIRSPFRFAGALVIAAVACSLTATSAVGQPYLSVGSSVYGDDEFCLDTSAALSDARIGYDGSAVGVSASYNNNNYPWPNPPGSGGGSRVPGVRVPAFASLAAGNAQEDFYLTRGQSFQAMLEVYPLGVLPGLRESADDLRRVLKPFVGVGVQITGDGDPAPASQSRPLPTYGIRGSTDLVVGYGAMLNIPLGRTGLQLNLQFRGTSLFSSGSELEGPGGDVIETESETLTWGTWLVGFRLAR